ncbi:MAG TPA: hypothetical protein VK714_02685 [Myxococcota bacterium]|nr:hypothetical protein [Myxococcota bacterium]
MTGAVLVLRPPLKLSCLCCILHKTGAVRDANGELGSLSKLPTL